MTIQSHFHLFLSKFLYTHYELQPSLCSNKFVTPYYTLPHSASPTHSILVFPLKGEHHVVTVFAKVFSVTNWTNFAKITLLQIDEVLVEILADMPYN